MLSYTHAATHNIAEGMDQPGKVGNPTRGLNKENEYSLSSPFAPENLASRDGFDRTVPRQPAHSPHPG